MQPTARAHWNPIKPDEPVPVIGVVPVIASTVRQAIKIDSLHRIESEPWKISLGKIHSYRVCGLAYNELDGLLTIDGSARHGAPAELHPDVAHLLERSDEVRVTFSDIHGRRYSSPLRVNEREVRWGSCEVSATYGGPLLNTDGDRRTSFVAVASTYHSVPYFVVDLLWHNADWEHVIGDIYHTGLELELPPGFHAVELHPSLAPDSGDWDILPMQGRPAPALARGAGRAELEPAGGARARFGLRPDLVGEPDLPGATCRKGSRSRPTALERTTGAQRSSWPA